jgi:hypothetical protein
MKYSYSDLPPPYKQAAISLELASLVGELTEDDAYNALFDAIEKHEYEIDKGKIKSRP